MAALSSMFDSPLLPTPCTNTPMPMPVSQTEHDRPRHHPKCHPQALPTAHTPGPRSRMILLLSHGSAFSYLNISGCVCFIFLPWIVKRSFPLVAGCYPSGYPVAIAVAAAIATTIPITTGSVHMAASIAIPTHAPKILENIRDFLANNKQEFVILDFQELHEKGTCGKIQVAVRHREQGGGIATPPG